MRSYQLTSQVVMYYCSTQFLPQVSNTIHSLDDIKIFNMSLIACTIIRAFCRWGYIRVAEQGCCWIEHHLPKSHFCESIFCNLTSFKFQNSVALTCISFSINDPMMMQAPEGIHAVCKKFPRLKIVTSEIDVSLNKDLRVIPGMGEFGDRYFGTGV